MTNVNIITTGQFASYAPEIDTSRFDAPTLSGIISQATQQIVDYIGYTPYQETITNEVQIAHITTEGDLIIFPAKIPVVSISALSINKGATTLNITPLTDSLGNNKYNIDYAGRNVRYPYGELALTGVPVFIDFYSLKGRTFYTKLTYVAGWIPSQLPAVFIDACVLLVKDILSYQYNISGASSISQGQISISYSNQNQESKFVKEALRKLAPYRNLF